MKLRSSLIGLVIVVNLLAATVLAACADGNITDVNVTTNEPVTLRLLTHDSFTPTETIFDDFTLQTGIKVELVRNSDAGTLVTKAVLASGNPEGDVLWGVDNTLLSRALDADVWRWHPTVKSPQSTQVMCASTTTRRGLPNATSRPRSRCKHSHRLHIATCWSHPTQFRRRLAWLFCWRPSPSLMMVGNSGGKRCATTTFSWWSRGVMRTTGTSLQHRMANGLWW